MDLIKAIDDALHDLRLSNTLSSPNTPEDIEERGAISALVALKVALKKQDGESEMERERREAQSRHGEPRGKTL